MGRCWSAAALVPVFQSSPGQKAGCNVLRSITVSPPHMFQSSPGQKAGCNPPARAVGCPSQGFNPHPTRRPDAISISGGFSLINRVFQSSPGQKAGCNAPRLVSSNTRSRGFNPHPARRPDAIRHVAVGCPSKVSILTRPEGRMQFRSRVAFINRVFQSSPGQKAGCNAPRLVSSNTRSRGFNPHPARRPDAISPFVMGRP